MAKKKMTIQDIQGLKDNGKAHSTVVLYDYLMAQLVDQSDIDIILVGDSGGMIAHGYENTNPMTMDQMIDHCQSVRRGAPNTFIIGDMPFGSYQGSVETAVNNAVRFIKEAGMDAIKMEGGREMCDRVRAITDAGIIVFGHIGLTPQSASKLGGFKTQGKTVDSARNLIEDALALEKAGVSGILVESVPAEIMGFLRKKISVPVYGCGVPADGQGMTYADMLGLFQRFTPKFVKKYRNLAEDIISAFNEFHADVRSGAFPAPENAYHITDALEDFEALFKEYE